MSLFPVCGKNLLYNQMLKSFGQNQLILKANFIRRSLSDKRGISLILKAFVGVWNKGFLFKLKQNGVSDNLLNILTNLKGRKQRVVSN